MIRNRLKITLPVLCIACAAFVTQLQMALATNQIGRLGAGMSNQLINDVPALSMKMQKNSSFAMGVLLGTKFADTDGGIGAGIKLYRIIFDEPQLNFYSSFMGAFVTKKENSVNNSGFQLDFTLGSEFTFAGLQSLGFSFEFGVSVNKLKNDFVIETLANHILKAAIHFYI